MAQPTEKTTRPQTAGEWHREGNALVDEGKLDRGISAFRRALRMDDGQAEVHNDLGAAYFQKGWHAEAEACFRKAIALKPEHGIAQANLGAALRAQGRLSESRRAFQRALLLKVRGFLPAFLRWKTGAAAARPISPQVREQLSKELKPIADALAGGRVGEALAAALKARERYPREPDALHLLAIALEESRRFDEALAAMHEAIALKADRTEYHLTHARILVRALRYDEALAAAGEALRLEPGSAQVYATISGIYHPWREDLAEQAARRALQIDPQSALAHGNLASALWGLSRLDEAEQHAREAVRRNPRHLGFRANLALVLKDQGKIDEARAMYREMIGEAPDYPKMCMDMGTLAVECDADLEAARHWYRKAQAVSDHPRAWLSEAIVNLLDYRFEEGWPQYEWRKQVPDQRPQQQPFERFTSWSGEAMATGRLLVHGEQGLGDEIMFASMFGDLARRVRDITVLCDSRVAPLFRRSFPGLEVIGAPREQFAERAAALQGVDKAVAAGSLGQHFRRRAADFPGRAYLRADPGKVDRWRERLAALGPGRTIGVSWIGGLQRTGRSRRSLAPAQLEALLALPGTRWISLQHNDDGVAPAIQRFAGVTDDIDELAALIQALDAVVTVCNTNVHVAGALGKPVLVMAPFVPEWRYGLSGERMIWYASARVFRQPRYGEWDDVVARVCAALTSA